jgi:molybdate transport system regulatory protein
MMMEISLLETGGMQILASINQTGSINKTAKEMKMSYKTVWSKIQTTEKNFGRSVVHADRKTGTNLTLEGKNLLEKFR